MKIEIKGVEFSNKGAELMLHCIICALDKYLGDYELVLTPGHLLPYQKRARLGAWQKFSFKKGGFDWTEVGNRLPDGVLRLLKHFGIVAEKEVDLVLDASGFVYSDKWDAPVINDTLQHMRRLSDKTRYIFLPQAFGPFEQKDNRRMMKQLIDRADMVIARDDDSYASLTGVEHSDKIFNFPDMTPLLDASEAKLPDGLPDKYVCIIPNSKMFLNAGEDKKQQYLAFLEQAINVVQALGLYPVVVNHEGRKDEEFCRQLLTRLNMKVPFYSGLDVLSVKRLIGGSVFVLSSRFHGCVSSLSQAVPTLATSWSHKYEQLFKYYGCDDAVVAVDDEVGSLEQRMTELLENRESLSEKLQYHAERHKAEVEQMWQLVMAKLK